MSAGKPDSGTAKVNDIRVHYELVGDGFPVIMIMGLGANLDWWDPRLIEGLSRNFRLVLFDNRGTGRTEASDREYTMRLLGDDAAGLMDALGISRAHVLGISMGGMIAQELALNHPRKVERLVLCSTHCGGPRSIRAIPEARALLARIPEASPEEAAQIAAELCFTKVYAGAHREQIEEWLRRTQKAPTSPSAYLRQLGAILTFDAYDRLAAIRAPTLVVHGRQDILIPPENGPVLAQVIRDAKLLLLANSAHGLAEGMDDATRSIRQFLLGSA